MQRHFEDAHATLDRVQAELQELSLSATERMTPHIRYLLERGRVFNSAGQPELARPLFLDAWQSATAANEDGYAVDAMHMLGIIEPAEQGLEWKSQGARPRASQP